METVIVPARKRIALIAHDRMKGLLVSWVRERRELLAPHELFATGTTGQHIQEQVGLLVRRYLSGPLGGDVQVGAAIAECRLDILIFFWDPLEAQPHDPDVKALLRVAAVWQVPVACEAVTADFLIKSPLWNMEFPKIVPSKGDRVASQ